MIPHAIEPHLIAPLHRLNQSHAVELSSLGIDAFRHAVASASHARAVGELGFLLAYDEGADYGSPNFLWFRARYERFMYVDRVVIAPAARGTGLARNLYEDLFAHSRKAGSPRVVAEFNTDPPNPGSEMFHARMGFETVGEAVLEDRGKTVRYITRNL